MQQKIVQNKTVKVTSKIEKYVWCIFADNIYSTRNPMQVVVLLQTCINLAEQRLKFSRFEGSIIP